MDHNPTSKETLSQDKINMLLGIQTLETFAPDLVQLIREMPDPKLLVKLSEQIRQGLRQLYAEQYRRFDGWRLTDPSPDPEAVER